MKPNFLLIGTMFLFIAFSSVSCSSDDDGGTSGAAATGTLEATIDGSSFQSNSMLSSANKVTQGPVDAMTIQGTDNSGKGFNFVINGFEGIGTYDIGGDNLVFVVANYIEANASDPTASQTWSAPYDNDSVRGTISISSDSGTNVKGTFQFTAKNPNDDTVKDITNGSFDIDYTTF